VREETLANLSECFDRPWRSGRRKLGAHIYYASPTEVKNVWEELQ